MKSSGKGSFCPIALFVLFFFVLFCDGAHGALYCVREDGSGDGSRWENALGEQGFIDTLAAAVSGDEFWIAAGTYRSTTDPGERTASFVLKSGVALYGGFAGTEIRREDRDWTANVTVFTGEIQGNDEPLDNSFHVLVGNGALGTAVLDGFTVTGGYADGPGISSNGGGICTEHGSPTVANCTFSGNTAMNAGAGMFNHMGSPAVTNCTFTENSSGSIGGGICNLESGAGFAFCMFDGNSAGEGGGGMYNEGGSPAVSGCTFSGNSASSGGGMENEESAVSLSNCTFYGNTAFSGAAMYNRLEPPAVVNCTFYANEADNEGGGIYNSRCDPEVFSCTFMENGAIGGGGIYNRESSPVLTNCIFWEDAGGEIVNAAGSVPTASYCLVQGGYPDGTSILISPPLLGGLAGNGGPTMTCALLTGSPAIDAGTSAGMPSEDQRGIARPQGRGFDMGAFEFEISSPSPASTGGGGCSAAEGTAFISLLFPVLLLASMRSSTPGGKDPKGRLIGKKEHNSRG
jgi:hypothetical protein